MWFLLPMPAQADPPPELGVVWALSVEGEPVGTRELRVRYEGETGTRVRIVEAYTEIAARRRGRFVVRQRLTANSQENAPASVHAVTETGGVTREVQARFAGGAWRVDVQGPEARSTTLSAREVDLSWVDLFDPESDRRLAHYDEVHLLSVDTGLVVTGRVVPLGPSDVSVGGEVLWTEGFALRTADAEWRFWYAANGFLVRYEEPGPTGRIDAIMLGAAPRAIDEFQVPRLPVVEEVPLP